MVFCIFLVGCKSSAVEKSSDNQNAYSYTGFAMGTTISEQIYGKSDLTKDIFSEKNKTIIVYLKLFKKSITTV